MINFICQLPQLKFLIRTSVIDNPATNSNPDYGLIGNVIPASPHGQAIQTPYYCKGY
jgi:hypothetical protein